MVVYSGTGDGVLYLHRPGEDDEVGGAGMRRYERLCPLIKGVL